MSVGLLLHGALLILGVGPCELAGSVRVGEVYDEPPPWVLAGAVTGMGRDVLLQHIASFGEGGSPRVRSPH